MTTSPKLDLERVNAMSPFNAWAGFAIEEAAAGRSILTMPWRPELGQYSGFLHAGVVAALLDTSCGFAAATELGALLTSQMSVSFLAPAAGERFRAEASLVRGGRRQVFSEAKLFASRGGEEKLVAAATAVLMRRANGQGGD